MDNILYNFLSIEEVREKRPGLSLYEDWQVQEALNMTMDLLDSECNGLILNVIQYSLSREVKDETNPFFRTSQELEYLKRAFIAQTQFTINLKNDQTSGSGSFSMGGLSINSSRSNNFNQVAPGVYENLQRARVYKMNEAFKNSNANVDGRGIGCLEKLFLTKEEATQYIKYYQPEAQENSILVVNNSHLVRPMKTQDIEWKTKKAETILDRDNEYKHIWEIDNLAFFGQDMTNVMNRQETYYAIWNAMWYNNNVTYPNEAIVRIYDDITNKVYTFKSKQDNNIGHNPLKDNLDEFWWRRVEIADTINYEDVADLVINSKEFQKKINDINNEISKQMDALWEQIKDNPHLLKKFEELADYVDTNVDKLEAKKLNVETYNQEKTNFAKLNEENTFSKINYFEREIKIVGHPTEKPAYLSVWQGTQNEDRLLYLGKPSSTNSDLVLWSKNDFDIVLDNNKQLKLGRNNNIYAEKAPTEPQHLTNKKYVDQTIANSSTTIDWENIDTNNKDLNISTNSSISNKFTSLQVLLDVSEGRSMLKAGEWTLSIDKNQNCLIASLSGGEYSPSRDNSITTKKYVDTNIQQRIDNTFGVQQQQLVALDNKINNLNKDFKLLYTAISGDVQADVFSFNHPEITYNDFIELFCYTTGENNTHKYIQIKSYSVSNSNSVRVVLNDKIFARTPYKLYGRVVGRRK